MKKKLYTLGIVLSGLILAGCGMQQNPSSNINEAQTVKIGLIAPISWPAAGYGEDAVNVAKHLIDKFNSSQDEYKVDLIVEDGKCGGKDSTSAAQKLINVDKVPVIFGGACSSETLGAGKIAQENKTVLVSAISSSPAISDLGDYVYRYRDDADTARYVAEFIVAKADKIALITENTDFAQGMSKAFKENFDGTILYDATFNTEEKDLDIIAKNVASKAGDAGFIVVMNQSDTSLINMANAFDKNGLLAKYKDKILFTVGIGGESVQKSLGAKAEGFYSYNVADFGLIEKNKPLIVEFEAKHTIQVDRNYAILEMETVNTLLDAVKAGSKTADDFKKYLDGFEKNQRDGMFGKYYFDQDGDVVGMKYSITQVQNGKMVTVQ